MRKYSLLLLCVVGCGGSGGRTDMSSDDMSMGSPSDMADLADASEAHQDMSDLPDMHQPADMFSCTNYCAIYTGQCPGAGGNPCPATQACPSSGQCFQPCRSSAVCPSCPVMTSAPCPPNYVQTVDGQCILPCNSPSCTTGCI
jgi:hypothetical protein